MFSNYVNLGNSTRSWAHFTIVTATLFPTLLGLSAEATAQTIQPTPPEVTTQHFFPLGEASQCRQGYVWREAFAGDQVCVSPQMRKAVEDDNSAATERRSPGGSCNPGFVWRLARPDDHVCVTPQVRDQTQVDNRLASSRLVAAARITPLTPSVRMKIPFPPQTPGCHRLMDGVWQDEPCVSDEYIRTHPREPPLPGPSIQSNPKSLFPPPLNLQVPPASIIWGSVAFNITSDPTQITEVDSKAGANAFSIQVNTNQFTCSVCSNGYPFQGLPNVANSASQSGDTAWVQFTYQQSAYGLCVWNWDFTVFTAVQTATKGNEVYGYQNPTNCVNPTQTLTLTGSTGMIGGAEVFGYITCPTPWSNSGCSLQAVGYLPLAGGWYASGVTTDLLGLAGNWTNVNGGLLGAGGGSNAAFHGSAQIQMVLRAYSCFLQFADATGYIPQACPPPPPTNSIFTSLIEISATDPNFTNTGETNNLTNGPATLVCNAFDCWVSYSSVSPP
jgi:hypothetical protein